MASLAYLKLTDKLACQASPAVYGTLHPEDLVAANDVLAIEDQEALTFQYARVDATGTVRAITAQLRPGRIIAVVWDDGSFDEWRVHVVTQGRGERGLVSVTCVPLWLDLVERSDTTGGKGWVSGLVAGVRVFEYELTQRTASSILSTYVIPNCPSYVTLGTVDPTYTIPSLTVSRMTPGGLAIAVRDALRSVDITCELRLRRNGTTDYKLDLVTQVGASASTPVFHPSNSLKTLTQRSDPTLQATRILMKGGTNPDGDPGSSGIARWRVGTPSGTTLPLTDRNGGASPIAFDGQWVGCYLLRVKTGKTFAITTSSATAGTVTCAGGISTIAADEDVELRLTEPGTNTRRVGSSDGLQLVRPFNVSGVASNVLTLTDVFGNTVSDPVSATDENVDWQARRMTPVLASTFTTGFSGGVLSGCASTAGIAAGDIVFLTNNTTVPYGYWQSNGALVVDSTTSNTITVHSRDGVPLRSAVGAGSFRVFRPVATLHQISASNATNNTLTVDAAGTAAAGDLIEFVQTLGAGEGPSYVDHPTYAQADPAGYGVKAMELSKPMLGVMQLAPNAWQRVWSNPANPPDGWVLRSGSISKNTNAAYTQYAGASVRIQTNASLQSPTVYPVWDAGHTRISARAWVYGAAFIGDGASITLGVYALTATGALGALLGSITAVPTDSTATATKVPQGAWQQLTVAGILLSDATALYGVAGVVSTVVGTSPIDVYVDVIEFYPFTQCPADASEYGDAPALLQAANNQLRLVASPPLFYTFEINDLERAFPAEYGRLKVTLGANARAVDSDYGIDTTVRVLRIERNLLRPAETTLALGNRPTLLSSAQTASDATQRSVINAIVAGQAATQATGPTYVQFSGAATLPQDAEVATSASGAPALTLGTDSSVQYKPADTSNPTTGVTSGTPPSRRIKPPTIATFN